DADPEHEVRDVESPEDAVVDAGHPEAHVHLVEPGAEAHDDDGSEKRHQQVEAPRRPHQRAEQVGVNRSLGGKAHTWVCLSRYMTFGTVPRSPSSLCPRGEADSRDTSLSGSFRSPNTIALAGHACAHAGLISPSFNSRLSASAWISPALIR